jgi:hypothetical protein
MVLVAGGTRRADRHAGHSVSDPAMLSGASHFLPHLQEKVVTGHLLLASYQSSGAWGSSKSPPSLC